jgi:hypothetical protein
LPKLAGFFKKIEKKTKKKLPECSSRKAVEPRLELFLEVGLDKVEGWIREVLATRPLPIEARLRPEGAGVGVGGKVAPLLTEFRDSLRRRVPEWLEGKNAKNANKQK